MPRGQLLLELFSLTHCGLTLLDGFFFHRSDWPKIIRLAPVTKANHKFMPPKISCGCKRPRCGECMQCSRCACSCDGLDPAIKTSRKRGGAQPRATRKPRAAKVNIPCEKAASDSGLSEEEEEEKTTAEAVDVEYSSDDDEVFDFHVDAQRRGERVRTSQQTVMEKMLRQEIH